MYAIVFAVAISTEIPAMPPQTIVCAAGAPNRSGQPADQFGATGRVVRTPFRTIARTISARHGDRVDDRIERRDDRRTVRQCVDTPLPVLPPQTSPPPQALAPAGS